MKAICFYFQVHQPFRLRPYDFFRIGTHEDYFDEAANRNIMRKVAEKCYLPANASLLRLIRKYGTRFKVSFSISGTALDQFERYAPDVLDSFRELAATGCVEFLSETYSHSLSALVSEKEFIRQVKAHAERIEKLFGYRPSVFRNTELICSDEILRMVNDLGFEAMLTEGAPQVLGWRSPNFLYSSKAVPGMKLLLKNFKLSDDIAFRFSQRSWNEWPLTAEKFIHWLNAVPQEEKIVNLFMDYETFGEHQWKDTGIFDFLEALPGELFASAAYRFITPSEAVKELSAVASLEFPRPVSWADEERDLSAWLGNELQDDAFETLYRLEEKVGKCRNERLENDWKYLQTSDHFYYMCTKYFSDGDVHKYFNHYHSPYEAFINYMNVLSDFEIQLNKQVEKENARNALMHKNMEKIPELILN